MKPATLIACIGLFLVGTTRAPAGVIIMVTQDGPDVVASGGGTLDLSALTFISTTTLNPAILPNPAAIILGPTAGGAFYGYISGPSSFGSGTTVFANTGAGDSFGLQSFGDTLLVPAAYISGTSLTGSATWDGTTISALGLTPGTYTWTWGTGADADSLTVNIGVPEPASLTLLGIGIAGIAGGTWLRRKRVASKVPA